MIWLLLVGLLALLLWYKFIWPLNHFTRMGVRQTKPWPILGDQWVNIFKVRGFADIVSHIYNSHPGTRYLGSYQFTTPTLVIRDPELVKQITTKDFDHFTDHTQFVDSEADPLWGGNVFSLKGQKWREMRATLSGCFTSSKMKYIFNIINEVAENFASHFWDKNEALTEVELREIFTRYTNDVIASSAFGIKVDSLAEPNNDFYIMAKRLISLSGVLVKLKFIAFFFVPKLFRMFKISVFAKEITCFFKNIIYETIEVREQKGIQRQDMINLLLEARNEIKNKKSEVKETISAVMESNNLDKYSFKQLKELTNDNITSQALIFFFAGLETISNGLCFGLYELTINKAAQDKLRNEIVETHKANNGQVTYEGLLKMKYLDMVLQEILRKWPPAVNMDRVCTKPYTIKPVYPDEKPVHLKIGDVLWLPMHAFHNDDRFFPNPEKFDPERFSDENKDSIIPYSYFPFGSGPRNCIGSRLAILEAKTMLYHLLLNFEIVPTKRTPIPLKLSRSFGHTAEAGFWLGLKPIINQ